MWPPTGLIPWFSKTEENTYATLLHHPFLFKGKATQCSRGSRTPQRNGVSEHRNHTLLDIVQSMMILTDLPISFWDHALETAAFRLKRGTI